DLARTRPLRVLQEAARKRRLEGVVPDELARRQQANRSLRHWHDDLGMVRFSGALPPVSGLRWLSRLDAETERCRVTARRDGAEEAWEAYAADALVTLSEGTTGRGGRGRTEVVLVADIRSYLRGRASRAEVSQIVGGGPVPVGVIREEVEGGAFVKGVLHDGVRVQVVKHFGRHIPAELRTVLDLGPPPGFEGKRCGCGCGKRYKLQFNHVDPMANHGPTCLANLNPLTPAEHAAKTRRDREAGLLGRSLPIGAGRAPP
ncbi:MAG: hypothetical protein QOG64_2615, partial [Acidimicrobiaceae bacterium]|nr:hypothetical protein [Acidimicrobiaceae bacterium]